jgi:hypothetical protein
MCSMFLCGSKERGGGGGREEVKKAAVGSR